MKAARRETEAFRTLNSLKLYRYAPRPDWGGFAVLDSGALDRGDAFVPCLVFRRHRDGVFPAEHDDPAVLSLIGCVVQRIVKYNELQDPGEPYLYDTDAVAALRKCLEDGECIIRVPQHRKAAQDALLLLEDRVARKQRARVFCRSSKID